MTGWFNITGRVLYDVLFVIAVCVISRDFYISVYYLVCRVLDALNEFIYFGILEGNNFVVSIR